MTDPDLPSKLRALYVETGANYVQAAADEIERLRGILMDAGTGGATHQCIRCLFRYTPRLGQTEDCPACGCDGTPRSNDD